MGTNGRDGKKNFPRMDANKREFDVEETSGT
jgi:hypothetical protein